MTVYTFADLQGAEGVDPAAVKVQLRISCFSGNFIRDCDFPMRFRDQAMKALMAHLNSGIKSFLVESSLYLTLWKEDKPVTTDTSHSAAITPLPDSGIKTATGLATATQASAASESPSAFQQSLVKYRGQQYVVNRKQQATHKNTDAIAPQPAGSEALSVSESTPAPRQQIVRQYRGQTYVVEI